MATPERGDAVNHRQLGIGLAGNIAHGEIILGKGIGQADKADGDKQCLPQSGRFGYHGPAAAPHGNAH